MRILTILGTRPEAIKLFPVIHRLASDARVASRTCSTGQHGAMLDDVLELAAITPDHSLDLLRPGQDLDTLMLRMVDGLRDVIASERPDAVLVQGDTATTLAGAFVAHEAGIRTAHVEAGLRSGDFAQPWPEEINRYLTARMAHWHFAPTQGAVAALRAEGVAADRVTLTGNTVVDALHWVAARPHSQGEMAELEERFAGRRIIGVTCHRRENWGEGIARIASALRRIAERPGVAIIFPLHPNSQLHETFARELSGLDNVALIEPLAYRDFARLMEVAHLMLTDSGGVQEEAPALGTPALVMRETTERPEGVKAGTARLVGTDPERIVAEVTRLIDDDIAHATMARAHNSYGDGRAAERIVEVLASAQTSEISGASSCFMPTR